MFCGIDIIVHNIPYIWTECGNILQNHMNPTKHCYGSELCYESPTTLQIHFGLNMRTWYCLNVPCKKLSM